MVLLKSRGGFRPRAASVVRLLSALAAVSALSCVTGNAASDGEASCAELGSGIFRDSAELGHYRVVSPNGRESFRVGDTMKVVVASGINDSEALIELAVTVNGSIKHVVLPGLPPKSVDTHSKCRIAFQIPDSLGSGFDSRFSLVSDSVRIKISWYNHDTYRDYSDGYFRITQ